MTARPPIQPPAIAFFHIDSGEPDSSSIASGSPDAIPAHKLIVQRGIHRFFIPDHHFYQQVNSDHIGLLKDYVKTESGTVH